MVPLKWLWCSECLSPKSSTSLPPPQLPLTLYLIIALTLTPLAPAAIAGAISAKSHQLIPSYSIPSVAESCRVQAESDTFSYVKTTDYSSQRLVVWMAGNIFHGNGNTSNRDTICLPYSKSCFQTLRTPQLFEIKIHLTQQDKPVSSSFLLHKVLKTTKQFLLRQTHGQNSTARQWKSGVSTQERSEQFSL